MKRILVVDDQEENLYLLRTLLESSGFTVALASQGAEALQLARQTAPDLIVSDILMPVMDGFTLCRNWKQDARLLRIPFMFYTATYTDERDREFALSLGAECFLVKPQEPETILDAVQKLLASSPLAGTESTLKPLRLPVEMPVEKESAYLKQYNATLVRKLEDKMQQLEQANRILEDNLAGRLRMENSLREAEARYRTLFEHSPDGIITIDSKTGQILEFNVAAHRQLGYSREEFAKLQISSLDAPKTTEPILNRLLRLTQAGRGDFETLGRTRSGDSRTIHVTAQIVDLEGKPAYHCIWRDITERIKNERQSRRSQRLEAIGTLASGVAHDLNNTLSPILMGVELLKTEFPAESEMISLFENSAKRAADMVRQLLSFAKGAEGDRVSIQLNHLLKEMQAIVRSTFPKNIRLVMNQDNHLPNVLGDVTQLHQVLLNLCVNARDAMPNGGTLTLDAKSVVIDAAYASTMPDAKPGNYAALRVQDTGAGIAPEILDRIFDPFFTTKGPEKGTGLGLSTVLGIVRGHGGFMQVYSQPGQGSVFNVFLPTEVVEKQAAPQASNALFRGNGEMILVVDDESSVRNVVRTVLRRLNFNPVVASDGANALLEAAKYRNELCAIITDLHMPHMDGLSFVRILRRMLPTIPVVVASGLLEDAVIQEIQALGLITPINKPFTEGELAGVLKNVLAGSDRSGKPR